MVGIIETSAALALFLYVVVRIRHAVTDRQSRITWFASLFGLVGLFCRGTLVSPVRLDDLLGGHNWLNLLQNLLAVSAFWLMRAAIIGLARKSRARIDTIGLALALVTIAAPFLVIDKGATTGGRDFVAATIGQPAMLIYAEIYIFWITYLAGSILIGMMQRRSAFYALPRTGALLVFASGIEYGTWAFLAHWEVGPAWSRQWLYLAFTPLFFIGVILTIAGWLTFTFALARQRRRAAKLLRILSPERRVLPGAELAQLYAVAINTTNGALQENRPSAAYAVEAERILSQNTAMQIPDFRRPATYKGK